MRRWLGRIAILLAAAILLLFCAAWLLMRGSLARLDGKIMLPGLAASVTIQRDALGVVTIDAANATDMARALGYVHAQERFFEMDLLRRSAAGELAELVGPMALPLDLRHRPFRMRARTAAGIDAIAGEQLPQLQAYTEGVNAGLAGLKVRPWTYLLLRQRPRPWQVADSALAGYAMFFELQDPGNTDELAWWKIKPLLPPPLFALLRRDGTQWDAPLFGAPRGNALLPGAREIDLRGLNAADWRESVGNGTDGMLGSNNWAVDGAMTADGRAILANDMHMQLRAPNIWFRVRLRYADARAPGGKVDVSGFTLPGVPGVIVGSNGHVAWGFTNAYIDAADWLVMPQQGAGIREFAEQIRVAGSKAVVLKVRESDWGPILAADGGRPLALRWIGQQPGALNFNVIDLARARNLEEAFDIADRVGMPAQNLLVADAEGHIGWRLIGALAQRDGSCDAGIAMEHCAAWPVATDRSPRLTDPSTHRLWTANNRVLDGEPLRAVGAVAGGYILGARAQQIRDALFTRQRFSEADMLGIQLDDRALLLTQWWQLLQGKREQGAALGQLVAAAGRWEGRATPESVSYQLVRRWRQEVLARIARGMLAPARQVLDKDFRMPSSMEQLEGLAWPLLEQQPPHLLPARFTSWDELLEDAARAVRTDAGDAVGSDRRRWGEVNTAHICHPLASAFPAWLGRWLCMPADELPGDRDMPRVAGPEFGATERMVVAPGHEADGIIEMPAGQSGNPLSPFWGAGHEAWVRGEATPFLPGATRYTLTLTPAR